MTDPLRYPETLDAAMTILLNALTSESKGLPYDEDFTTDSTMFLAVGTLVAKGLDPDTAMSAVDQAMSHGDIRVTWSEADGLQMTIGDDA